MREKVFIWVFYRKKYFLTFTIIGEKYWKLGTIIFNNVAVLLLISNGLLKTGMVETNFNLLSTELKFTVSCISSKSQ